VKVFIWEECDYVSDRYHDDGGLTVVARGLEAARRLIAETCPKKCAALTADPTLELDVVDPGEERIFVFRNAGCC